jgi:hypothetical protein
MLVSEIKDRVKRQFGDESGVQVTDADIVRWINDGMREIAQRNDLLEVIATSDIIANQQQYELPSDILTLNSVYYEYSKLDGVSLAEAQVQFNTDVAPPVGLPRFVWVYANTLNLYPIPDSSITMALKVYYTRLPVLVANDADTPELPLQYHPRIVEYCLQQAYELDEDWAASGNKNAQLVDGLNSLKDQDKWTQRASYPVITVMPWDDEVYG